MTIDDAPPVTTRDWAHAMLAPGAACIIDTETTALDGAIIELAILDAATGATLLDTLVDPGGIAISPGAHAVHGITAGDLVGAPTWTEVFPTLAAVTRTRAVLAYNAPFDRARVLGDCHRHGLEPLHLADAHRWHCLMDHRSRALGTTDRLRLDGGHRALADAHAARAVLYQLIRPS